MNFTVAETPVPVRVIPNFEPSFYVVVAVMVALMFACLAFVFIYRPKRVSIKVTKHPDGTYNLKYSWGWHFYDSFFGEHHQNIESLKRRVAEILEQTEWKKE